MGEISDCVGGVIGVSPIRGRSVVDELCEFKVLEVIVLLLEELSNMFKVGLVVGVVKLHGWVVITV